MASDGSANEKTMSTLLLCFIHGFSGDDDTFHSFPTHLRDAAQASLPEWKVVSAVYPKYETKGDLPTCVAKFREWLQSRVDALEAESNSLSTSDSPSVRVILVAHSMGGFVAADAVISIVDEQAKISDAEAARKLPWIQGLLAVDTPFLGIASPMLAYSAFSQFTKVSNAYRLMSMLPLSFMRGKDGATSKPAATANKRTPWELGAIPAWRTVAAYTGTTGALAAAGVAAYMNREELFQGYTWIQNHLQFVGVIMKREQSRLKLARITALEDFGFANLYTSLGQNSVISGGSIVPERTFCALPPAQNPLSKSYRKEINLVAKDEIDAHTSMFQDDRNPGYNRLLEDARELVIEWAPKEYHQYRTKNLEEKTNEAMDERVNDALKDLPADQNTVKDSDLEGAIDPAAIMLPADDGDDEDLQADKPEESNTEQGVRNEKNEIPVHQVETAANNAQAVPLPT